MKLLIYSIFISGAVGTTTCVPDKYCQNLVGPASYCRTWLNPATCQGGSQYSDCQSCGSAGIAATVAWTTKPMVMTVPGKASSSGDPATSITSHASVSITTASPSTTTLITTTTPSSAYRTTTTSSCELMAVDAFPAFVWIEGPRIYDRVEFVAFYQRLASFVASNCVNVRPATLIIRTAHPFYPPNRESMYWPPWTSPMYTELISKISTKVKILLYPYILDSFARTQWVNFAKNQKVGGSSPTVYDGIFSYINKWQSFVNTNNTATIDGYILDYEEITANTDPLYAVTLTQTVLAPYKAAYPSVETAVTIGYDDKAKISLFEPFMDYLYLQVYDLYYPTPGADATLNSIFEVYRDNPDGLLQTMLANVLTTKITDVYKGRESKVALMWSTQSLSEKNCLYKLNDGSCGINYEFNWKPHTFNKYMQMVMKARPVLTAVSHGIYTYNFMRQDWLLKKNRL